MYNYINIYINFLLSPNIFIPDNASLDQVLRINIIHHITGQKKKRNHIIISRMKKTPLMK